MPHRREGDLQQPAFEVDHVIRADILTVGASVLAAEVHHLADAPPAVLPWRKTVCIVLITRAGVQLARHQLPALLHVFNVCRRVRLVVVVESIGV